MKKIMIMAVTVFMATAAMAQNPAALKQVKGTKDYKEAAKLVEENVSSMVNEEKADAYNKVVDLALAKYDKESNTLITNQAMQKNDPVDMEGMYDAAYVAVTAALECDKYDQLPTSKGKVKPRFRKNNGTRITSARTALINLGQEQFNSKDFNGAVKTFGLYVDSKGNPLFSENPAMATDQYWGQIAYYAALASYNAQDYTSATKYSMVAQEVEGEDAKNAMEILILAMKAQLSTKEDSLKYHDQIKELYEKNPTNERFFSLLTEYYTNTDQKELKNALINKQVQTCPDSKMAWALKGEGEMGETKWSDAIDSYRKSLEIDPEFIQVRFNLALCLNNKAITLKDENNGILTDEAKKLLTESVENLVQLRKVDPDHQTVNWPYMLYQAYYLLGDEDKAKELESLIQ